MEAAVLYGPCPWQTYGSGIPEPDRRVLVGSDVCGEQPMARGPGFCQVLIRLPDQVGSHAPHVGVAHGDRARLADKTGRSRSQVEPPIASGHLGAMVQTYIGSEAVSHHRAVSTCRKGSGRRARIHVPETIGRWGGGLSERGETFL